MAPVSLQVAADTASFHPMNASFLSIPLFGDLKYHFIHLWQVLHSIFCSSWHSPLNFVSFPSGSCFMKYFILPGMYFNWIFILSWQLLHSLSDFVSFLSGSYFIEYFVLPGIYCKWIFISSWQLLHSLLYFASFPSGRCFIKYFVLPGIYFN